MNAKENELTKVEVVLHELNRKSINTFLRANGLKTDGDDWGKKILAQYRHKPLVGKGDKTWTGKNEIYESFERLFHHFRHQQIILSYREDGIPSVPELVRLLQKYHKHVSQVHAKEYQYVLSQRRTKEVLILAQ